MGYALNPFTSQFDNTGFGLPYLDARYVNVTGDTMTGALMVDGSADAIQFKVQGHSAQTANLQEWQNSSGTVLGSVTPSGGAYFAGNVGIGTTSPVSKLDVYGGNLMVRNDTTDAAVQIQLQRQDATNNFARLILGPFTDDLGTAVGNRDVALTTRHQGTSGSNNVAQMWFNNGGTTIFDQGIAVLHVTSDNSQRVGIGTTSPLSRLHIISEEIGTGANKGLGISNYNHTQRYSLRTGVSGSQNTSFTIYDETSSANRLIITSGGNIGIGTTSPAGLLEISTSSADSILTLSRQGVGSAEFRIGTADYPFQLITSAGRDVRIIPGGTTAMTITHSGNVGIGTTSPGQKLDVAGTAQADSFYIGGGTNYRGRFIDGGSFLSLDSYNGTNFAGRDVYLRGNTVSIHTGSSAIQRLTVDSVGNVGIGTTSPDSSLEITKGSSYGHLKLSGAQIPQIYLKTTTSNANQRNWDIVTNVVEFGDFALRQSSANNNDPAAGGERLYINRGGNVGIGTTAPGARLHVVGSTDIVQTIIKANATQTANLQEWQNSSGSVLSSLNSLGYLGIGTPAVTNVGIKTSLTKTNERGGRAGTFFYTLTQDDSYSHNPAALLNSYTVTHAAGGVNLWTQQALLNSLTIGAANVGTIDSIFGSLNGNYIETGAGGTVSSWVGAGVALRQHGLNTLNITNFYSFKATNYTLNATVGSMYGFYNSAMVNGTTTTNAYGIYLENVSGATTNNYAIYTNTGLNRLGDQLSIVGSADRVQSIVKAHSTQTANLQEWQNSSGTVLGGVDSAGRPFSYGGTAITTNAFFQGAGNATLTGGNNIGFGASAFYSLTSGTDNFALGRSSLGTITTGSSNVAIGNDALNYPSGGTNSNVAIGFGSMKGGGTSGVVTANVGIGKMTLYSITSGGYNMALGLAAGSGITSGSYNIFIGTYAGANQTSASRLFIVDAPGYAQRASAAEELTNSILYGVTAALPADQTLRINAALTVNPQGAAVIPLVAKGAASQTANLQEWQNSSGTVLGSVTPSGGAYFAGNVGIGITNPTYPLRVNGEIFAYKYQVQNTQTETSGFPYGISGSFTANPSSASTAYHRGAFFGYYPYPANLAGATLQPLGYYANNLGDGTIGSFTGVYSDYDWGATRNVSAGNVTGVQSMVRAFNAGTITNWTGVNATVSMDGGNITTARGINVAPTITSGSINTFTGVRVAPVGSGAVTKYGIYVEGLTGGTNNYGIYLGDSSGGSGQNYSIYSAGGNNYFAGNVGIGTATPGSMFSVGSSSQFQVNSSGDIVKIKNLTYSWPSSHVSSSVLTNDGSGNLTWEVPASGSSNWDRSGSYLFPLNLGDSVGIGTNSPANSILTLAGEVNGKHNFKQEFANDDWGLKPTWYVQRARGTLASKANVQSGDDLMLFEITGYYGTGYNTAARMYSRVDGTPGTSSVPGNFIFATTPVTGTNPIERMIITSAGSVGVGTTTPAARFEVSGSEATAHGNNAAINLANTASGGVAWTIRAGATGTYTPAGAFSIASPTAYRLTILSGGHVGIGTENPQHKLHVSTPDTHTYVAADAPDAYSAAFTLHGAGVQRGAIYRPTGTNDLRIWSGSDAITVLNSTTSPYVGIRDTSPNTQLTIAASTTADQGLYQSWRYVAGSDQYTLKLKHTMTSGVVRYTFDMINNSTAYSNVLTFDRGKVGIGTTEPVAKLTVDSLGLIGSANQSAYDIGAGRIAAGASFYAYDYICAGNNSGACDSSGGVVIRGGGTPNTSAAVGISTGVSFFNGGAVGIGTNNPGAKLDIFTTGAGTGVYQLIRNSSHSLILGVDSGTIVGSHTASNLQLRTSNTTRIQLESNGVLYMNTIYNQTVASGNYPRNVAVGNQHLVGAAGTSSIEHKTNVSNLGDYTERLYSLRPVFFEYKEHPGSLLAGLIAEETAQVLPELVTFSENGKPEGISYYILPLFNTNELIRHNSRIKDIKSVLDQSGLFSDVDLSRFSLTTLGTGKYGVVDSTANGAVTKVMALHQSVIANLGVGFLTVEEADVKNLVVNGKHINQFVSQEVDRILVSYINDDELVTYSESGEILSVNYPLLSVLNMKEIEKHEEKIKGIQDTLDSMNQPVYTSSKVITSPGWYRIAQLDTPQGSGRVRISNSSLGSSQNITLQVDMVGDSSNINVVSNFVSGNSNFSKMRLNSVSGVMYLEVYIENVSSNLVSIRIEPGSDLKVSSLDSVEGSSSVREYSLDGINFGIGDMIGVSKDGVKTSGSLLTSGSLSNVGDSSNRWNDIYTKGTIRLGSGSSEGGIRYNMDKGRLEFSNDGKTWLEMGDLGSQMVLSPEYSGAILYADGSDNNGRMTSDAEDSTGEFKNYYQWVSDRDTLQDYDILVRITLPSDFVGWNSSAISLDFMTENSGSVESNKVDMYLMNNSGIEASVLDGISKLPGSWERITIKSEDIATCKKAGDTCTLRLSMYSKENYFVRVGDISLNYNRGL